ncbi:uncharacterized protein LOC120455940 [Drosophila santomea]|uniref:uncharacterized protein LOC120455940 n=1 Tax=Drosophila santomea TaxID=129105 RepID=UPI001954BBA3|nr:uncharacterized protein LOC120455940 [Drosophila santomea]
MNRNKPLRLIGLEDSESEKKPKLTLNCLSVMPIQCPLESCIATIFRQDMLDHLASQHLRSSLRKHLQLAFAGERCTLIFDPSQLPARQTICLGVLLYGGERGRQEQLPGVREFSHRNRLPANSELESLQDYLPVMVLVRRTTFLDWALLDRNKEANEDKESLYQKCSTGKWGVAKRVTHLDFTCDQYAKCSAEQNSDYSSQEYLDPRKRDITGHDNRQDLKDLDMYIIWTQSAPCIRPLHVCLTAFNRTLSDGRSVLRLVANSGRVFPEIGGKELPKDRHSMWLTQRELEEICGAEYHLHLEVILNESLE